MQTNGSTTLDVLETLVEDLYAVPPLFQEPKEGWVNWAVSLFGSAQVRSEKTIAGRLIAAHGPAWAYGIILPKILSGEFERRVCETLKESERYALYADLIQTAPDPQALARVRARLAREDQGEFLVMQAYRGVEAKRARLLFESGRPLYIGVFKGLERFKTFEPVLTYHPQARKYQIGLVKPKVFAAESHVEALEIARNWFLGQREKEVQTCKALAGQFVQEHSLAYLYDKALLFLKQYGALYDYEGTRLAWQNGAHGYYAVQGVDWCYAISASPEKAAQMALLALFDANRQGQKVRLLFLPPEGQSYTEPALYGFTRWEEREDHAVEFETADGRAGLYSLHGAGYLPNPERGVISLRQGADTRPAALLSVGWVAACKGSFLAQSFSVSREKIAETLIPLKLGVSRSQLLMWVVWRVLEFEAKRAG